MTTTPESRKTPWHVWVVGIVAVLWNAMGSLDFTMTVTKNTAYLKAFTPEQLDYLFGFPLWVKLTWGVATWGSLLGSILILARSGLARHVFLVAAIAMLLTMLHNFVLTDGLKVMHGGAGQVVFAVVIVAIGFLLLWYSYAMTRRGVLR